MLGAITAGLVVGQAWLIANMVSHVVVGHEALRRVRTLAALLLGVILCRATIGWLGERMADRASASAKSDLRGALAERIALLGPAGVDYERPGSLVVLATSGIDALDSFFARYLPQLFLAVIVPVTVIVVVLGSDWISAVIIAVTVPLIPLFMALVGASTKARMQRQARLLERLAGHFLDVVAGLPTLKVFGRAKAQVAAVPRHHRPVPHGHDGHAQGRLPLVANPGAPGYFLCGPGGSGGRPPAAGGPSDAGRRPVRAHPGPRGLSPSSLPRHQLSRQR